MTRCHRRIRALLIGLSLTACGGDDPSEAPPEASTSGMDGTAEEKRDAAVRVVRHVFDLR